MRTKLIEARAEKRPYNGTGPNVVGSYQMSPPTEAPFVVTGVHETEATRTHVKIMLTPDEARKLAADIGSYLGDHDSGRFTR